MGLLPGPSPYLLVKADDVDELRRAVLLVADAEGDVIVSESGQGAGTGTVADMVHLYMFGDSRESSAAQTWLLERMRRC
ncbi:MAG: hypothetical protein LBR32_07595 [Propionibacteriaceae bacterium]|nr:hypothetical protein [Propionibacteriaceae bacterium]